jgi:hypothetical protein
MRGLPAWRRGEDDSWPICGGPVRGPDTPEGLITEETLIGGTDEG